MYEFKLILECGDRLEIQDIDGRLYGHAVTKSYVYTIWAEALWVNGTQIEGIPLIFDGQGGPISDQIQGYQVRAGIQ